MTVTHDQVLEAIENIAETIENNETRLNELDSKIGDGDHGVNLKNGFRAVLESQEELKAKEDIGAILQEVGQILIDETGGSVGILYGTAFREAGTAVEGTESLELDDMVDMAAAACDEVERRGQVSTGEKTMFDTLKPFSDALAEAAESGYSESKALRYAESKAEEGMVKTEEMVARKGRAKYFGEDTLGHRDVGAVSTYLILSTAVETVTEDQSN
ncbi:MAG: dihydroxyacetone kinase subunit DhaL [Halodesulfurarchaeum sp.]